MNKRLNSTVVNGTLSGSYDEKFGAVAEEFEQNFRERDEFGASVCVMLDGAPVVDLWGGTARRDTGAAWNSDTLSIVWSSTKVAISAWTLRCRSWCPRPMPMPLRRTRSA